MDNQNIIEKLDTLESKMDLILRELENVKEEMSNLKKTTGRMDDHISFVEATYQTLKTPLDMIRGKMNYFAIK